MTWKGGWLWIGLSGALALTASGVPVEIRPGPSSDPGGVGFALEAAVDGQVAAGAGWRPSAALGGAEITAVFLPTRAVSARQLLLQLFFPGPVDGSGFARFGVDVTTDRNPALEGRWMPLILEAFSAADPSITLPAAPMVVLEPRKVPFSVTLRARVPFDGISGFRLRAFPPDPKPDSASGTPQGVPLLLGEFRVEVDPPTSTNLALGRQVYCSRQVAAGLPSRNLTDGFHATWSQPETSRASPDAFFQMDLGQPTALDHLVVRWRQGQSAPPGGYELELLSESGGFDGKVLWAAQRPAPTFESAVDVVRAADGDGTEFEGRSLMLRVKGGPGDQPQIAELEVYPSLRPRARQFLLDGRPADWTGTPVVPAHCDTISFAIVTGTGSAESLPARWRLLPGREDWQETVTGTPVQLQPVPAAGQYRLEVQARHSDGVWDQGGVPFALMVAAPWWTHLPSLLAVCTGLLLSMGAGGWWWWGRRMQRRLLHTRQHLALQRDRLRISRDMHDEIGARLTSIAMLAERTQRQSGSPAPLLEELAAQARTTVEALDTIVWAVNPRHDTIGGLADYLSDYVPSYLTAAGLSCLLDFQVQQPDQELPLAVRHSLLMATKEALQNVVKHAGATQVTVQLVDPAGQLILTICDDGAGFPASSPAGITHSGLENMKQRLAEVSGTCQFQAGPEGTGACVRLQVPLSVSLSHSL